MTWEGYHRSSNRLARVLVEAGLEPGERVAVLLPDGASVHVAFLANEKAGLVTVGIGARAGEREIRHLVARTGAVALLTHAGHRGVDMSKLFDELRGEGLPLRCRVTIPVFEADLDAPVLVDGEVSAAGDDTDDGTLDDRRLGPDDLFLLNSTSGTTGLPKCVMHTQNRWFYFHQLAVEAGEFTPADVFLSAIPAPFGFGLWTAHFTPAILGSPTIVAERFDAGSTLDLIERERVTVLACVSTQFIMMLNEQEARPRDLSSLRCMFTGGEAVPYERAAEFEERTGAAVLQFYGSNETGALSRTTSHRYARAPAPHRRAGASRKCRSGCSTRTAPTSPVWADRVSRAARGRRRASGYYDDEVANAALFTPDGWMLMGDIVELDDDVVSTGRRPGVGLHHPGREEHQRPGGRGGGRRPIRAWPWWRRWPCPTRSSASGSASTWSPGRGRR